MKKIIYFWLAVYVQGYGALLYSRALEQAMGFKVAEIQPTPNPNALKFILDRSIAEQPTSFFTADAAHGHPMASKLFAIPGVSSLLLLGDFVTVNKRPEANWADIKRVVRQVLAEA